MVSHSSLGRFERVLGLLQIQVLLRQVLLNRQPQIYFPGSLFSDFPKSTRGAVIFSRFHGNASVIEPPSNFQNLILDMPTCPYVWCDVMIFASPNYFWSWTRGESKISRNGIEVSSK